MCMLSEDKVMYLSENMGHISCQRIRGMYPFIQ